jgi:hypothetical protein
MNALELMIIRGKTYQYDYNKDIVVDVKVADFVRHLIFDENIHARASLIKLTKDLFKNYGD